MGRTTAPFAAARRWLAAGGGWPVRTRPGVWYGRWLSSRRRLGAVCAACRSSNLSLPDESVERAICRSRRCFHRAAAVSSWPPPPVGRGSWGLMPLAARHTAISPNEGGAQVASRCVPRLAGRHLGRRGLGPGRRGRRPVGIALPGSRPRRDGHGALMECPGARAADLGWWA